MTREEIKERFRQENPEITDRVLTEPALNSWCVVGNKEVACKARAIKDDYSFTATTVSTAISSVYDLTSVISRFYDIDDSPGGGVIYDNDPLDFTTIEELNLKTPSWRTRDSGKPKKYYRRGAYLGFDKPTSDSYDIQVYTVLFPDDLDDDDKVPFDELSYLAPFHDAILFYLTMRAKFKIGKESERAAALQQYNEYVKWMKTEINRGTKGPIQFRPSNAYIASR